VSPARGYLACQVMPPACDLWQTATQRTVPVILCLVALASCSNEALEKAGLERSKVYLTNVVKHFKWIAAQRGKKTHSQKPRYSEIHACRPWLDAELRMMKPQVLVCLGSTAAESLLGRDLSVTGRRGQLIDSPLAPFVVATLHPSSILRADEEARHLQMQAVVNDLKMVAALARKAEAA
jgi:uracil-DNA glycosylase family 4